MTPYNLIAETPDATVVTDYTPDYTSRATTYQSEADLERELIRTLGNIGYEHLTIKTEQDLIANLRTCLADLNHITFTDSEWTRFFTETLANKNESIIEKTRKIQTDHIQLLTRDDGTIKNIYLIDKTSIHNNKIQVLNQYEETGGTHQTRYDVTLLINGLPLIHIELKRRGVAIREAFNQIKRYQRDSFWASSGLFEYIQIFVISNGTNTKYYSNTTRNAHLSETKPGSAAQKTSNSFEFTSYWADANNKPIPDLIDFAKTFLQKHTLLAILTRYCVLTTEDLLLVMRPYQIAATERILARIKTANAYHLTGTDAGGYIWHTTGSGKTLTSFKTALLASQLEEIDKVIFIVDRKDLDYQTMKEYDRFQKGAANSNTSTKILTQQLNSDTTKIIITTIQKLQNFISKNKTHKIYTQHLVLIFDECHRSQFGDMHHAITKAFRHYHLFGFTGTPIFAVNAQKSLKQKLKTTEQAFGDKLHTYTIVDAIADQNVLPFKIDYYGTIKQKEDRPDKQVTAIDTKKALQNEERIRKITSYLLENFDAKTKRNTCYPLKGRRVNGFNAIFAVESIPMLKKYYLELQKQLDEQNNPLTIAAIYSYSPNQEDEGDAIESEDFDNSKLSIPDREFLEHVIQNYNRTFQTNFSTDGDKFENYYKDISNRVKQREVDLLLVVNMFLTGFDAPTLNTLWVDKNLKHHGLLQAFSRTNRILNSVKTCGNIICFRNLQKETDSAIALFGDKDARGTVLIKTYDEYYNGYDENGRHYPGYRDLIAELLERFPLGEQIIGEQNQKEFIALFGSILRLQNLLTTFDEFAGNEILTPRDTQDYRSIYLDLYAEYRTKNAGDKEDITDDVVFEIELIKQVEINIDYILLLVAKYHESNCENKEVLVDIRKAIDSSLQLRSKKELIERFIEKISYAALECSVEEDWRQFVRDEKEKELTAIIAEQNLKPEKTETFISNAFRDGVLKTTGTDIDKILPPVSRFGGGRQEKKQGVIERLMAFFEKYKGII